jgi:hypothetical protein
MSKRQELAQHTDELRDLICQIEQARKEGASGSRLEPLLARARMMIVELADLQDDLFEIEDERAENPAGP